MSIDPKELRDIDLRTMQREMAGGLASPKSRELVDLRTVLTALYEIESATRAKVEAECAQRTVEAVEAAREKALDDAEQAVMGDYSSRRAIEAAFDRVRKETP